MAATPVEVKKSAPVPTTAGPPDVWSSFRTEMDRLFDRFSSGFGMPYFGRMFETPPMLRLGSTLNLPIPAMDVSEDANSYKLTAELPGMEEKDVEVALSDDLLTLKGVKKYEEKRDEKNYTLTERSYGSFERSFTLPDGVDRDKVSAEFAKGVLTITLPKLPEAKVEPKKIAVKAAA